MTTSRKAARHHLNSNNGSVRLLTGTTSHADGHLSPSDPDIRSSNLRINEQSPSNVRRPPSGGVKLENVRSQFTFVDQILHLFVISNAQKIDPGLRRFWTGGVCVVEKPDPVSSRRINMH